MGGAARQAVIELREDLGLRGLEALLAGLARFFLFRLASRSLSDPRQAFGDLLEIPATNDWLARVSG